MSLAVVESGGVQEGVDLLQVVGFVQEEIVVPSATRRWLDQCVVGVRGIDAEPSESSFDFFASGQKQSGVWGPSVGVHVDADELRGGETTGAVPDRVQSLHLAGQEVPHHVLLFEWHWQGRPCPRPLPAPSDDPARPAEREEVSEDREPFDHLLGIPPKAKPGQLILDCLILVGRGTDLRFVAAGLNSCWHDVSIRRGVRLPVTLLALPIPDFQLSHLA